MAPKKKEQQKMSLGDFLTDGYGGGSWADEVEETYVAGTQPLPPSDRPRYGGGMSGSGGNLSSWQDRGYAVRETFPTTLPDKPPFTAHLGNLSYEATTESVTEFFQDCDVMSVRIIEDREMQRPKGFGYVEFTTLDGLKKALDLDGQSFQGRMIRIKIADPPRGGDSRGDSSRDLSDWTRKGPLPDLPNRGGGRPPPDFGDRRPRDPAAESRPTREMTWERRGPLSPLPQQEAGPGSRDASRPRPVAEGLGERSESHRGSRQGPPAWGEGRRDNSRTRRDAPPERAPTAAEKDLQWRERMRPDAPVKSASPSRDGSEAPPSPSMPSAVAPAPTGRPRLNLQKRTVSEATTDATAAPASGDSKASPFGAARPIDTATREKAIEEKRQQAIREKREAEDKAKEERRLAKQAAAAKAEAEAEAAAAAAAEAAAREEAAKQDAAMHVKEDVKQDAREGAKEKAKENVKESPKESPKEGEEQPGETKPGSVPTEEQNGASAEAKAQGRAREPREPKDTQVPNYKSRATEAGNWRSASGEQRPGRGHVSGPRGGRGGGAPRGARYEGRGGRANGSPAAQQASAPPAATDAAETPHTPDNDGWTTVPNKKGRQGRPVAS